MFLAMFDMPDVAQVFCPEAPKHSDDPEAIIVQAQLQRIKKAKEAAAEKTPARKAKANPSEIAFTWGAGTKKVEPKNAAARVTVDSQENDKKPAANEPEAQQPLTAIPPASRRNAQGRGTPTADL